MDSVEKGFSYNSKENNEFLKIDEIRKLITDHIDPDLFQYDGN